MMRACDNCGTETDVAVVSYTHGGERVSGFLCATCKESLLGRRRQRSREPSVHTHRRPARARLARTLSEGGPIAYVGVGLFAVGLVLVPALVVISLLTR